MLVGKQTPRKNVQLVNPPSENTTVIGHSNYFGFGFTTLKWKPL